MPNYHKQYPVADSRQHDGQGTFPEPTPNKRSESLYDQAAREYRDMLMSKGTNYDPSGNRGSNPCPKDFLLPEDAGWDRGLRARQILSDSRIDADRAASHLHNDTTPSTGETSGSDQYSDSGLSYPWHVHVAIIGIALTLVCALYFIPPFIAREIGKVVAR